MYIGLLHLHSNLPYLLFLAIALVLVLSIKGLFQKTDFSAFQQKSVLFSMILIHIQWTVGLVLYFISPNVKSFSQLDMSNSLERLYALEHPIMMTIALVLLTIARSKSKKTNNSSMNKTVLVLFGLALGCILFCLPPSWL
ncbi:MAG: hypothetical protein ACON4Y_02555 [Flavobacteriales bacterium]